MIRYVGIAVIFVSMVYAGKYAAYTYKQRQRELDGLCEIVAFITIQIEYYNLRLDEIYSRLNVEKLPDFTEKLKQTADFEQSLAESKLHLKPSELATLTDFAQNLGKSSRDEQLRLCRYTEERLKSDCESSHRDLDKRVKVAESMGLCVGLMAFIALL